MSNAKYHVDVDFDVTVNRSLFSRALRWLRGIFDRRHVTHIERMEITVSSNQDPSRVAREVVAGLERCAREAKRPN